MKHVSTTAMQKAELILRSDPKVQAHRAAAQFFHGDRVEERQRVNGQPNGYRPVTEAELRAQPVTAKTYKPTHGGYPSC